MVCVPHEDNSATILHASLLQNCRKEEISVNGLTNGSNTRAALLHALAKRFSSLIAPVMPSML